MSDTTATGRNFLHSADVEAQERVNVSSVTLDELFPRHHDGLASAEASGVTSGPNAVADSHEGHASNGRAAIDSLGRNGGRGRGFGGETVALWHLDTEGAEMKGTLPPLRSGCLRTGASPA